MSSQTTAQKVRGNTRRGRGANRGRGKRGGATHPTSQPHAETAGSTTVEPESKALEAQGNDKEVCWICAESVKYYSVSNCDHRTCHVCALRLRALYKKMDCTFCKVRYLFLKH